MPPPHRRFVGGRGRDGERQPAHRPCIWGLGTSSRVLGCSQPGPSHAAQQPVKHERDPEGKGQPGSPPPQKDTATPTCTVRADPWGSLGGGEAEPWDLGALRAASVSPGKEGESCSSSHPPLAPPLPTLFLSGLLPPLSSPLPPTHC